MGIVSDIFHEIIRDTLFEVGHLSQSLGLTIHWGVKTCPAYAHG